MTASSERINKLGRLNNSSTYLEIGVAEGRTFKGVQLPHKTAVDPSFKFNTQDYKDQPDNYFFEKTSNEFFTELPNIRKHNYGKDITYDIIYIDGLHVFSQALQDFTNSLAYSHDKTIWIFDDTVPSDPYSSITDAPLEFKVRRLAGITDWPWHGDVFKCVYALHDFYPEFSWATVYDQGNPQTVVWKTNWPSVRKRIYGNISDIEHMTYFDMLARAYVLNLTKEQDLLDQIGKQVSPAVVEPDALLKYIVKRLKTA